jgi:predicted RNA polymerase sigma factor
VARASGERTDWNLVVALYEQLQEIRPSPIVHVNRAIAVAEANGAAPLSSSMALTGRFRTTTSFRRRAPSCWFDSINVGCGAGASCPELGLVLGLS